LQLHWSQMAIGNMLHTNSYWKSPGQKWLLEIHWS
jgi:hypothetical protein